MVSDGQRRAVAGGEAGPNGEWYRGGTFIATTDAPKSVPSERRELTADARARRASESARAVRIAEWVELRRSELADVITALTANVEGVNAAEWQTRVENHQAGFLPSLGRTLWAACTLSARQAEYVARAIIGRRTKRNAERWDALVERLTAEWRDGD